MSEEQTIRNLALKIAADYQLTVRERTDELLRLNAIQHSNLGKDSSIGEKKKVKLDSKFIFKEVNTLDNKLGQLLLNHMDK